MTTPWKKAIIDLWQERTRTLLVVLAITLGISGFATVLSTFAILTRELDRGYLATNPASATIWTDATDDDLVSAIELLPSVSDAEQRRAVSGRMKVGPIAWRDLTLFVVRDYGEIRVSTLTPEEGAWPPGPGEILIERDAFQVAKTKIGESITVRVRDGDEQTLRVTGRVHDVGQAQARMENVVYGYITLDTLAALGEDRSLNQLKLLVAENRFDESHVRDIVAEVSKVIEGGGHPVRRVEVPTPGKHPHARHTGMLLLAMSSFGFFILLLSGVLVANLLTGMMAAQIRQIGVMKAIGGTRGQIARIYCGQAGLLGLASVVIAIPLSRWGSRVFCRAMAVFLNFDIASFHVPLWVDLVALAIGVVVPLLASAYPVWKGTGVSIQETLTDYGVSGSRFGATWFDRMLTRAGGRARPVLFAIRNSFRRRSRLVLTLVTLSAGGIFFMTALNVRSSLIHTLDVLFESKKYDVSLKFGSMVPYDKVERAIRRTKGIAGAEGWIVTEGSTEGHGGSSSGKHPGRSHAAGGSAGMHGGGAGSADRFPVLAIPSDTSLLALNIVEGRRFAAGDVDTLVVNTALAAKDPRMKVGNMVTIRMGPAETTWRIVGVAREPFSPPVAYISRSFFDRHPEHAGTANSVRLALDKTGPIEINRVKFDLEKNLEAEGLRALSSASTGDSRYGFDQHMLMIYIFLIVVSCLVAGVGGLGLATTLSLNVMERRREMGVLRAIGASPRTIWLIVMLEGVVVGLLGWIIATIAAWPVSKGTGDLLATAMFKGALDFRFEFEGVLIWLGVSIMLSAISSLVPAWHASRFTIREALAHE